MSRFKQKQQNTRKQHSVKNAKNMSGALALIDSTRLRVVLLVLIVLMSAAYLWLVNTSAASGFYLTDLENQRAALLDEQQQLQVLEADLKTLTYIQEMNEESGLVQTTAAEHLDEVPSTVAVAE